MVDYAVYLLYRVGTGLFGLLPLPSCIRHRTDGRRHCLVSPAAISETCSAQCANRFRRRTFGKKMRRIVRRHFQQLGANLLCSVKFPRMPMEKILERVRIEHFEHVENCFRKKQPFVMFLSHIGSWEFCTRLFPHFSARSPQPRRFINVSAIRTSIVMFAKRAADLVLRFLSAAKGLAKRLNCSAAAVVSGF